MTVVWHGVPRDMVGDTIYPLWQVQQVDRDLFDRQYQKYLGREATLDYLLPILGVRFNDTVHCSAVHPHRLFAARLRLGFNPPPRPGPPASPGCSSRSR